MGDHRTRPLVGVCSASSTPRSLRSERERICWTFASDRPSVSAISGPVRSPPKRKRYDLSVPFRQRRQRGRECRRDPEVVLGTAGHAELGLARFVFCDQRGAGPSPGSGRSAGCALSTGATCAARPAHGRSATMRASACSKVTCVRSSASLRDEPKRYARNPYTSQMCSSYTTAKSGFAARSRSAKRPAGGAPSSGGLPRLAFGRREPVVSVGYPLRVMRSRAFTSWSLVGRWVCSW